MSEKITFSEKMRFCIKNGITVYPVHDSKKNTWHIEANNNGKKTTYQKPIKEGKSLKGEECQEFIEKTYLYWYDLIKKKTDETN